MEDKIKHDKKCEGFFTDGEETIYGRICGCVQRERKNLKEWKQKAVLALQNIKKQGKVCENFELYTHESCRSSYTSWAIVDKVLNEFNRNS